MTKAQLPRIAILGLFGECNAFRAPIPQADYTWMSYHEGASLLDAIADPAAFLAPEIRGFFARMDETGPWRPVPVLVATSASGPPLEEAHLQDLLARMERGLRETGPVDAVFIHGHGSVVAEETKDVDAAMLGRVRAIVGPDTPIVEILDPHGKVTRPMVELADLLISYRTDPHVDMAERGAEAADAIRRLLGGERLSAAYVRLPIMIPTVAMVKADAAYRPAVALGTSRLGSAIANVSVVPSYPWTDTPFAGFHILVSAWGEPAPAAELALELADFVWSRRDSFRVAPLELDAYKARAAAVLGDPHLAPICFADIADNPGGGATSNTTYALKALLDMGATEAALGPFHDPAVAAQAHAAGLGAAIDVDFNRDAEDEFARRLAVKAVVVGLSDGVMTPRSGPAKGIRLEQGPTAALLIDGVVVLVTTRRLQAMAVEQFEIAGIDLSALRVLVVKSRGHYQAAFSEFFSRDQMVEIDTPGWCTPHLSRLPYKHVPRPLYPMDEHTTWMRAIDYLKAPLPAG